MNPEIDNVHTELDNCSQSLDYPSSLSYHIPYKGCVTSKEACKPDPSGNLLVIYYDS